MKWCQSPHPWHQGLRGLKWWWQLGALFAGGPVKGKNQWIDPTNEKTLLNDNKSIEGPIVQECKNQNFPQKRHWLKGRGWGHQGKPTKYHLGGTKYWLLISGARVMLQRWVYCEGSVLKVTQRPNPDTWERGKPFYSPGCQRQWWELFVGGIQPGTAMPS